MNPNSTHRHDVQLHSTRDDLFIRVRLMTNWTDDLIKVKVYQAMHDDGLTFTEALQTLLHRAVSGVTYTKLTG